MTGFVVQGYTYILSNLLSDSRAPSSVIHLQTESVQVNHFKESVQTNDSYVNRTSLVWCTETPREKPREEDGGHWPFPVRSGKATAAGSAAAVAGLGDGSDRDGSEEPVLRSRKPTGQSALRSGRCVYGRLLRRGPGGGGGAPATGSRYQPRQYRRADGAASGNVSGACLLVHTEVWLGLETFAKVHKLFSAPFLTCGSMTRRMFRW